VTYSANTLCAENWVNPLRGYAYDSFNKDALLRLATVKDGRITLPGGASYKVLVVPGKRPMDPNPVPLSKEVRAKIKAWKRAGVFVPTLPYTADDFTACGVRRDVIVPEDIAWAHRQGAEGDVYFIANQRNEQRTFTASLRVTGRQVECWNPQTGEIGKVPPYTEREHRTEVTLTLAPYESTFVVLTGKSASAARYPVKAVLSIDLPLTPYTVRFLSTGKTLQRKELFDWSRESDQQVRYYSGTAVYRTTFQWEHGQKLGGHLFLNLGKVCDIATVRLNGKECGTAWTAPYCVDLTDALVRGMNELEIEVTNTWANALLGADEGKAPFAGIWTNARYRRAEKSLLSAGLLGPLTFVMNLTNETNHK
jgi:hypothetical protein